MQSGECYEFNEDKLLAQILRYAKQHNGDGKFQQSLGAIELRVNKYASNGTISNYTFDKCSHLLKAFKKVRL